MNSKARAIARFSYAPAHEGAFLFDHRSGFIYFLNLAAFEILSALLNGKPMSKVLDLLQSSAPTIRRHAIIYTLSATGGKLGRGLFPFDRREAEARTQLRSTSADDSRLLDHIESLRDVWSNDRKAVALSKGGQGHLFMDALFEYGILS